MKTTASVFSVLLTLLALTSFANTYNPVSVDQKNQVIRAVITSMESFLSANHANCSVKVDHTAVVNYSYNASEAFDAIAGEDGSRLQYQDVQVSISSEQPVIKIDRILSGSRSEILITTNADQKSIMSINYNFYITQSENAGTLTQPNFQPVERVYSQILCEHK